MIHTETKFAYHHKPTGKWCFLEVLGFNVEMYLLDEFESEILYNSRNFIEEDLLRSSMDGERYAANNFSEFELVEIEIEYRVKA